MAHRPFVAAIGLLTALMIGAGAIGFTMRSMPVVDEAAAPIDRQFVVECTWSHRAADDPIVHPDQAGASHMHDFFGSEATNASSTAESLRGTASTCQTHTADTAAYWVPTLYAEDRPVESGLLFAYYRRPGGVAGGTVLRAYPFGLVMVAGAMAATDPQATAIVGWHCGASPVVTAVPVQCSRDAPLALRVAFPSCWDGEHLDSADHRSHVAYADRAYAQQYGCPASHPVTMPELVMDVVYDFVGDPSGLQLASGGVLTGHADFMNAWDPAALEALVADCLDWGVDCGIAPVRVTSAAIGAGD
jgi:hypothetical protein